MLIVRTQFVHIFHIFLQIKFNINILMCFDNFRVIVDLLKSSVQQQVN